MRKFHLILALVASSYIFTACSDSKNEPDPNPGPDPAPGILLSLNGYAELGAFQAQSKVHFYPLNKELKHSKDQIYSDEVTSELGNYHIADRITLAGEFFEIEVTGKFYNAITTEYSKNDVTMRAINHVATPYIIERDILHQAQLPPTNINILTQLTAARIRTLLKKDANYNNTDASLQIFQKASKQAMEELMQAFSITHYNNAEIPSNISFWNFNWDSGLMAAISSIILEGVGEEFLNNFFTEWDTDFAADGRIDNEIILETIHTGQQELKSETVQKNLETFYAAYKKDATFPPFWQFIDRNGDGVIDENDKPADSNITEEELTPSEQQCIAMLEQINKSFREYIQIESVWEANLCGVIDPIPGYPTTLTPTSEVAHEIWASAYAAIRQCNNLIYLLASKEYDYNVEPYIGTIYTIQSQIYLNLTQLFGDVPHVTPENFNNGENSWKRTPVKEIYAKQLEALKKYGVNLPQASAVKKHFTNFSAFQLLMATMYMEMHDFESAAKHLASCGNYYLTPYIWKVDNSESAIENKPLYHQYIGGPYHIIYHKNRYELLRAEYYLATNQPTEAFETLKKIESSRQANRNEINNLMICFKVYGEKYMGKSSGYFALLKRLGIAKEVLQLQDYQLFLPIPLQEMSKNPMFTQNPGYY